MNAVTRERIRTILFMVAITFVITAALAGIQLLTAERVARNQKLFLQRAILEAGGIKVPSDDVAVMALYKSKVVESAPGTVPAIYTVRGDEAPVQTYVLLRRGAGLWGKIDAAIGVDRERKTVVGIVFMAHGETPGLGARIEEPWFKRQFGGRIPPFRRVPEEQKDLGESEINSITGATITTKAVQDMVEKLLAEAKQILPMPEPDH